jgi:hypothetical protein
MTKTLELNISDSTRRNIKMLRSDANKFFGGLSSGGIVVRHSQPEASEFTANWESDMDRATDTQDPAHYSVACKAEIADEKSEQSLRTLVEKTNKIPGGIRVEVLESVPARSE